VSAAAAAEVETLPLHYPLTPHYPFTTPSATLSLESFYITWRTLHLFSHSAFAFLGALSMACCISKSSWFRLLILAVRLSFFAA